MNLGEAVVFHLESLGVDTVFGGAGEANADILFTLKKSKRIKTIIVKNEQAASFMACGYSMFTNKLGVCFATAGPGEFNLFSGLAVALSDSLPVLAISAFTPKHFRGKGALNEASGHHRTPDSRNMFASTTKKSFIIEQPNDACDIFEEAVKLAFEKRPGPVHIHLPSDIYGKEVENFRNIQLTVKPVLPDSEKIAVFADILEKAIEEKEPIIAIIGYGAVRSQCVNELLDFVEKFQIPFITTMDAKGILPENHPLSLGGFGTAGDPGAKKYFHESKYVLGFGNSFAQNATFSFKENLFQNKTLLHVNIDKNEIGKVYHADHFIVSDIKPAIVGITSAMEKKIKPIDPKVVVSDKHFHKEIQYNGPKIHPALLVKEISKHLPENSIIMGDAGGHMLWLHCYLKLTKGQIYQNPGSFGPMASSVNGAIGVKCSLPNKHIIVGCGDGAYLMSGFELLTAVQYQIPVIWIIFNNNGFNVIKQFQKLKHNGQHAFTDFNNPDYAKYAEACGAKGYKIEQLKDFAPIFIQAIKSKIPTLIDVILDEEIYPPFSLES